MSTASDAQAPTIDEVLALEHRWYHVVELADGVTTPGWIDVRHVVHRVGFPERLDGVRALDVGTADGFWAFELERRGASVVAIDSDQSPPPDTTRLRRGALVGASSGDRAGLGFDMLKRFFDSKIDWRPMDVRALTAESIGGAVDLAVLGSVLLHLRDPVGALETIYEALTPDGRVILIEPVDTSRRLRGQAVAKYFASGFGWTWWYPTLECLKAWVETAGFVDVTVQDTVPVRDRTSTVQHLGVLHARLPSA